MLLAEKDGIVFETFLTLFLNIFPHVNELAIVVPQQRSIFLREIFFDKHFRADLSFHQIIGSWFAIILFKIDGVDISFLLFFILPFQTFLGGAVSLIFIFWFGCISFFFYHGGYFIGIAIGYKFQTFMDLFIRFLIGDILSGEIGFFLSHKSRIVYIHILIAAILTHFVHFWEKFMTEIHPKTFLFHLFGKQTASFDSFFTSYVILTEVELWFFLLKFLVVIIFLIIWVHKHPVNCTEFFCFDWFYFNIFITIYHL